MLPNNTSLETLRENKLCYKCHDKYFPGHVCKAKTLNSMESNEGETILEVGESPGVTEEQKTVENQEEAEVNVMECMAADEAVISGLEGPDKGPTTIKILGILKNEHVIILVDSGATHSFLDPELAKKLQLIMQPMIRPMKVRVANGVLCGVIFFVLKLFGKCKGRFSDLT